MGLTDKQLRDFAEYLMPEKKESPTMQINATVHSIDSTGEKPIYYVNFDGAEGTEPCPVNSTLGESLITEGDRVSVVVQNREGTIIGNLSEPIEAYDDTDVWEAIDSIDPATITDQYDMFMTSSTQPLPDDSRWSTTQPSIIPTGLSLWVMHVIVTTDPDDPEGTIIHKGQIQKSNILNGVYTFMDGCADGSTTINGGCIETGTLRVIGNKNNGDYISVTGDSIGLIGTNSKLNISNGSMTLTYNGSHVFTTSVVSGLTFWKTICTDVSKGQIAGSSDREQSYSISISIRYKTNKNDSYSTRTSRISGYSGSMSWNGINVSASYSYEMYSISVDNSYTGYEAFVSVSAEYPAPSRLLSLGDDVFTVNSAGGLDCGIINCTSIHPGGILDCDIITMAPGGTIYATSYFINQYDAYDRETDYYACLEVNKSGLVIDGMGEADTYPDQMAPGIKSLGVYQRLMGSDYKPNMHITSNGWINRCPSSSSRRYKHDITTELEDRLNPAHLYNIPIVQFKYNEDRISPNDRNLNKNVIGLIAEDVFDQYPIAACLDINENGDETIEDWNERYLIPAMLYLIQDQKNDIEMLKERINEL